MGRTTRRYKKNLRYCKPSNTNILSNKIVSNAKTLFKIANVVNSNDQSIENNSQNKDEVQKKEEVVSSSNNSPIFYL